MSSPNMNLPIPTVGTTDGPDWASDISTSLTLVDAHDHSSGYGVPISPSGLNINTDLPFGSNSATGLKSVSFTAQSAPLSGSLIDRVYVSGVDLYFNDGSGNQVRITQSGGVAGSPGSISNLTAPASAAYVAVSTKFVWESDSNTAADMDCGAVILRNLTASSFGLTLQPPTLSSNYSITLPSVPASSKFMSMDNTGVIGTSWAVDNSTLEISGSTLQVKAHGITATQILDATITGTQVASNINLAGKAVQEGSKNVVVSNTNATNSLSMIRGSVSSAGSGLSGEGFSASRSGTGTYTVTFSSAFGDTPSVVVTIFNPSGTPTFTNYIPQTYGVSTTTVEVAINDSAGTPQNAAFSFIAIGQRA